MSSPRRHEGGPHERHKEQNCREHDRANKGPVAGRRAHIPFETGKPPEQSERNPSEKRTLSEQRKQRHHCRAPLLPGVFLDEEAFSFSSICVFSSSRASREKRSSWTRPLTRALGSP